MRCGLVGIGALALLLSAEAGERRTRHYSGVFHGYLVRVSDRPADGGVMREVTMTARDSVTPYRLYGMHHTTDDSARFRLGVIRYARDAQDGCVWSRTDSVRGAATCMEEQVEQYSRMLAHAIEDVVR